MIIQVRHSTSSGNTPLTLANGELAINSSDELLYYRHANGSLVVVANGAALFATTIAQVSSNLTQTPANTTPYKVTFNSNDLLIGTTHVLGNTRVGVLSKGWYQVLIQGEVRRTSAGGNLHFVDYWLQKNGINIPKSSVRVSLKDVNVFYNLMGSTVVRLEANDYIEVIQTIDLAGIGLGLTAPTVLGGGPPIPSVSLTLVKISN